MSIPLYYESDDEFEQIHHRLKQYPCPFCRLIGCLILHGFLSGYNDTKFACKIKRGHRVYCSNRNRRKGCGRTCSILLSCFIKHFYFTARTIWRYLLAIVSGICKMKAMKDTDTSFSQSAPYGLWCRLRANVSHIRTCLSRIAPPPNTDSSNPEIQTIKHLQSVFGSSENPISAFQLAFQTSFLSVLPQKPGVLRS
jgi:hypothetical protein